MTRLLEGVVERLREGAGWDRPAARPGGLDTAASRTDTTMVRLDTLHKDSTKRP